MKLKHTIKYICFLPVEKKVWLFLFFVGSLLSLLMLRFISMNKIMKHMGYDLDGRTLTILATEEQIELAKQMGKLMSQVANNTPWKCECLSQALCVKWLLNRYKIPSVFFLGASFDNLNIKAHAWVNVKSCVVVGGPQNQNYKVIATYTTPRLT